MPKFIVEQVAIAPKDPAKAIALLTELGAEEWARDHVKARGTVFGNKDMNGANLAFNYDLCRGAKEFEVLHYTEGDNWMATKERHNSVSHLGMHVTLEQLEEFKAFFAARGIGIAQEVETLSHTNPVIAGKRRYCYCIFDTKDILGVDLKFIIRIEEPKREVAECLVCGNVSESRERSSGHQWCDVCKETTNHVIGDAP